MNTLIINVDGGARNNQNNDGNIIAGWGAVLSYNNKVKKIKGHQLGATNNQMELTAAIESLKSVKNKNIPTVLYADSNYVVQGINVWSKNWRKNGWRKSGNKKLENAELWKTLTALVDEFSNIEVTHVKRDLNTEADVLANEAMDELALLIK